MSVHPHDWIPSGAFPALLRCARCPAEAALALDIPRKQRPAPLFERRLIWRAHPDQPWRSTVPVCGAGEAWVRRPARKAAVAGPARVRRRA